VAKFLYGNKDVKAFAAAGRGIKNLDVTPEQLKRCEAPILFINGSKEASSTKERAAAITKVARPGRNQGHRGRRSYDDSHKAGVRQSHRRIPARQ
jgi:hypothetical protein